MPRTKILTDGDVLEAALRLMHASGPQALTFAAVARASGLSASTLVQRFGTKALLVRATLQRAWDQLDDKTARIGAAVPRTAAGAVELLAALSRDYGDIEAYAEGLLILREDLRDPALRARGAHWKVALCRLLDDCLAGSALAGSAKPVPPGIGLLLATQWQGSLLWWSFDPQGDVESHVRDSLRRFLAAIGAGPPP
ncbi:TetR family transcriptional regulator [Stella humosa]|uniref:TetR family transcriptional regulator n=1 Tax=Stella humosa TaxID=94 RepID=A0A3N1M8E5_9PROT|nr:helix-turn-helix domain-containing protein [Stella humosa]ROP99982.1 TetR family transcriptional regulator [Stella humosa]BBK30787.1 TetR family transcriptional regulator [Stella humosa]